jgi:DNA polymerase
MMAAQRLARAVHRDIHKMRAFVRFTKVGDDRHVAWFEPAHHIVEANAPFFMRRFTQMRWAILTPRRCVEWDGHDLHIRPGADPRQAPSPDAGEALWLTYYAHIFNPARLKLKTMAREMPRRYWPNLPEAALIEPLARAAAARSYAMVAAEPSLPAHQYKPIMIQRVQQPSATSVPAVGNMRAAHHDQGDPAEDLSAHLPTLAALRAATQACRNCPIGAGATQAVCGEGPSRHASHMIVGEQPGDKEDLVGRPFVGPAGKLLTRAMEELDWPRESVYVTNAVKHFKYELRGTRRMHKTPGQREIQACVRWLDNEIELVKPERLVALGATAAFALLGRKVSVTQERGTWLHERADGIPVLVTWHPSALLRQPEESRGKAYAQWRDDLAFARKARA